MAFTIRPARLDDADAIESFTANTWPEHGGDYVPRVFESWVEGDGADARTLVAADADGPAVGLLRTVLLSPAEAWCAGMRVDPDYRGEGVARGLSSAAFDWARERGASVARCMVFSWNASGLGAARAAGFGPGTEFRWAHPTPSAHPASGGEAGTDRTAGTDRAAGAESDGGGDVEDVSSDLDAAGDAAVARGADPGAVWSYWQGSRTREHLDGLALDPEEPWALSSLTRGRLADAAEEDRLVVVGRGPDVLGVEAGGVRGFAVRVRVSERGADDEDGGDGGGAGPERWAEYGVADWRGAGAAADLFDAVARDAASVGADRTRVLIPETTEAVSDVALARVEVSESPDFVLAADLTERE